MAHEDVLPYTSPDPVPIQHELFDKFLMHEPDSSKWASTFRRNGVIYSSTFRQKNGVIISSSFGRNGVIYSSTFGRNRVSYSSTFRRKGVIYSTFRRNGVSYSLTFGSYLESDLQRKQIRTVLVEVSAKRYHIT